NDPVDPYGGWWWVPVQSASSFHPGGANFAFADGSARFIKESIATWQNNLNNFGDPVGVAYGPFSEYRFGASRPQVYQFLSTRSLGEIASGDTYCPPCLCNTGADSGPHHERPTCSARSTTSCESARQRRASPSLRKPATTVRERLRLE